MPVDYGTDGVLLDITPRLGLNGEGLVFVFKWCSNSIATSRRLLLTWFV